MARSQNQPKLQQQPNTRTPKLERKPRSTEEFWVFSFRYWKQIEHFGIGQVRQSWMASLLDRLESLSKESLKKLNDPAYSQQLRFHEIDWDWQGCPICRQDLNWIDQDILDNIKEYPIYQIVVSKALGRIVGFFSDNIFHIVLLDPAHNLQPSDFSNYKLRDAKSVQCEFGSLMDGVQQISKKLNQGVARNVIATELERLSTRHVDSNLLFHYINDEENAELREIIVNGHAADPTEILRFGIEYIKDNLPR